MTSTEGEPVVPDGPGAGDAESALALTALRDVNEQLVLATLRAQRDVEDAAREQLLSLRAAEFDPLTGLARRALMLDRFAKAAASARRHGTRLGILFVDINNFKQVNDALGHAMGDNVLQRAAACLLEAVREADTVSRYGGDEFVMLLTDIGAPSDASGIADKVCDALAVPARFGDHVIRLTASIGISLYPDHGTDAEDLINRADSAMYRAKRRGTCSHAFYEADARGDTAAPTAGLTALLDPVMYVPLATAEQERQNVALREANEQLVLAALTAQTLQSEAEAAQSRQSEFMAVLAHELRNPLVPIRNVAAVLARTTPDDAVLHKMQAIIERQVAHMARLVDDLLDVTRASAGKLRLDLAPVDVSWVIANAIEACRPAIDLRLQRFSVSLPLTAVFVHGDAIRLTQIVTNLLDNASKYTPDGGVLSVLLATADEKTILTVTDDGIGIPATALPGVFEMFVQDPAAVGFSSVGLGIGLKVVHELVTAHDGSIEVHSDGINCGSRFVVTLPVMAQPHATSTVASRNTST